MLKETYFSPDTIQAAALEMLQSLEQFRRRHPIRFHPRRSALLALDLQSYFTNPASHAFIPSALAILPGINALITAYAHLELPVFLTQHVNTPQNAGRMADWWRDTIAVDDPLSEIDARIERASGIILRKTQYDAFLHTALEDQLHERSVTQVVICGVMTHLCCETTARSAFMRGFEVYFCIDGAASYTQAFHRAALLNLAHGFAVPALVEEILSILEASHGD